MRNKANVINTIPPTTNYPFGRIKDDTGLNDGTPIVEANNGDIQETVTYFMNKAKITPNELPDNVQNGYQIAQAIEQTAGKFNTIETGTIQDNKIIVNLRLDNIYNKQFILFNFLTSNQTDYQNVSNIDLIRDIDGNEFQLFVYGDFKSNFFNNSLYIIERQNDFFLIYSLANKNVLNNIYEKLEKLELSVRDVSFHIDNQIVPVDQYAISVSVPEDVYQNIISCSIAWKRPELTGSIRTFHMSSDNIRFETDQEIGFVTQSNSPNQIFVNFTGFTGLVLNDVKLIVKCR